MRHCRITLEYDGTAYSGWQCQKNAPSIQEELEKAAARLAGRNVRARGAGRTDSGVHARGQVAVLTLPAGIPVDKIPEALNSRLPEDIAVISARPAAENFDPRHDCVMKQYSYSFTHGPVRPALGNKRSWHTKRRLDLHAMRKAAALFAGWHDFTSFCNRELAEGDNRRELARSELLELPPDSAGRGRLLYVAESRGFLYNQVRAMAGTLFGVGSGRYQPEDLAGIFAARDRAQAGESAPPWGLCLEWVLYPGEARPPDGAGLC